MSILGLLDDAGRTVGGGGGCGVCKSLDSEVCKTDLVKTGGGMSSSATNFPCLA